MANIVQFYGHRRAFGLSVSPNALHRNPSYTPVQNADLMLRSGDAQYVIFDVYSAARTSYFTDRLNYLIVEYEGRVVHEEYLPGADAGPDGKPVPIIVVYEVYP
jgi:hypothetical protein